MATAVAEEAHLAPLEALEPSTAVRVMLFLGPRDLARAARASKKACVSRSGMTQRRTATVHTMRLRELLSWSPQFQAQHADLPRFAGGGRTRAFAFSTARASATALALSPPR